MNKSLILAAAIVALALTACGDKKPAAPAAATPAPAAAPAPAPAPTPAPASDASKPAEPAKDAAAAPAPPRRSPRCSRHDDGPGSAQEVRSLPRTKRSRPSGRFLFARGLTIAYTPAPVRQPEHSMSPRRWSSVAPARVERHGRVLPRRRHRRLRYDGRRRRAASLPSAIAM